MLDLATSDTPVGFVAFIPIMAVLFSLILALQPAGPGSPRDTFIEVLVGGACLGAAAVLLFVLPSQLSWEYWINRYDLLVPGLFVAGSICLIYGVSAWWRFLPVAVYLLFMWPVPYVWLQSASAQFFTDTTLGLTRPLVLALSSDISNATSDAYLFLCAVPGHQFSFRIGTTCSGMNTLIGFVVVALPILYLQRGSLVGKAFWLFTGLIASFIINALRLVLLFVVARFWSVDLALNLFHPVLGLILFAATFAVMVELLPRFGLLWPRHQQGAGPSRRLPWLGFAAAGACALALAYGDSRLSAYAPLEARAQAVAMKIDQPLPEVPGFKLQHEETLDWVGRYFGSGSLGDVFTYRHNDDNPVWVQMILATSRAGLSAYSVENCYKYHGDTVPLVTRVDLGSATTGTIVHYVADGTPGSTVYWIQPVQFNGNTYQQRISLILDLDHLKNKAVPPVEGAAAPPPPLAPNLLAKPDVAPYAATDELLTRMASFIIHQELTRPTASR